ncbi:choice-of-anchor W domain-containing protein [Haloarcula rubra]|uniref:choice-of-anchor W domain-containing protein n=1 Tax=Haloarcula rubra TaxID=2487747 RepID=UPI003CCC3CEC
MAVTGSNRWGNWELSTSRDDTPNPSISSQEADYPWQNGQTVPFTLAYNQDGNDEARLTIDGSTAVADTTSYPATGDSIGMTLKVTSPSTMSVSVSNLRLDGLRLSQQSAQTGSNNAVNLHINRDSISDGFVLTGSVTFGWSGSRPSESNMQLNFEIEEDGTGSS